MKTLVWSLVFPLFILTACTKADPEAYRRDPILQDYLAQQAATSADLEATNKQVESTKKEINESVPQSGQRGIHQNKLSGQLAKVDRLTQQLQFWKIRIESRAKEAQSEYLKAFKNKKEWPDKTAVDAYFAEKRLRQAKMQWDQKDRIQEYRKANAPTVGTGGSGANQAPPHGGN